MNYRLAIIEDDNLLRENYTDVFGRQGYRVDAYSNRVQAQEVFQSRLPDLAIIDIGLGDEVDGGFALCQWLRAKSRTLPIIFLSARDDDIDIVSGLRMGADDYLTKDVSLPHLVARVAALFRRIEALASDEGFKHYDDLRGSSPYGCAAAHLSLERSGGRADVDRVLDDLCAGQAGWAREESGATHAGSPDGR